MYFLWHTGQQAAYGQPDEDNGADNGGQWNGKRTKAVMWIHATGIVMQTKGIVMQTKS